MTKYVFGKHYQSDEIKGEAKELPDLGYPIPDYNQNMYELERLFTESHNEELRAIKRKNDIY